MGLGLLGMALYCCLRRREKNEYKRISREDSNDGFAGGFVVKDMGGPGTGSKDKKKKKKKKGKVKGGKKGAKAGKKAGAKAGANGAKASAVAAAVDGASSSLLLDTGGGMSGGLGGRGSLSGLSVDAVSGEEDEDSGIGESLLDLSVPGSPRSRSPSSGGAGIGGTGSSGGGGSGSRLGSGGGRGGALGGKVSPPMPDLSLFEGQGDQFSLNPSGGPGFLDDRLNEFGDVELKIE